MNKTPLMNIEGILAKMEYGHFTGSIKDRNATYLVDQYPAKHYVVASSGNFGIGVAAYALSLKRKCTCFVSSSMSKPRLSLLSLLGIDIIKGTDLADCVEKAKAYAKLVDGVYLDQFDDIKSVIAHFYTTKEVIAEIDRLDYLVCGIGSGSTISGLARILKVLFPNLKVIGIRPTDHLLEGIGPNFVPKNLFTSLVDEYIDVSSQEVFKYHQQLLKKGYLVGPTAAANLMVSKRFLPSRVLTVLPDHLFKYLGVIND